MATEIRQRFNAIMKEELAGFKGSCLYVGRADLDGEGGRYRDYGEFSSFKTVDIVGEPDFLCSIEDANVIPSDSFDLVIFCWVVEHVKNPYAAMMEVQRIARMELIVGYPINYPKHADPMDLYRFLPGYAKNILDGVDVRREFEIRSKDGRGGEVDFCQIIF